MLATGRLFVSLCAALAAPAVAESLALAGEELHCIGDRAHVVRYSLEGPPARDANLGQRVSDLKRVEVALEPAPTRSTECSPGVGGTPSADKQVCFGANQDATCTSAKADIPLPDNIQCRDCFVGASADLYAKVNYSFTKLYDVEVGMRDVYLRTAASADIAEAKAGTPISGSKLLDSNQTIVVLDKLVGCPICLRMKISVRVPAVLDYALHVDGQMEAVAGAEVDVHLGDQAIRWDYIKGWEQINNRTTVLVKPLLSASASGHATLNVDLATSLLVDVDDIIWFRTDAKPALQLKLSPSGSGSAIKKDGQMCIDGDADFTLSHEADLHWSLLMAHEFHHWGPTQDFSWSQKDALHKCAGSSDRDETELIV